MDKVQRECFEAMKHAVVYADWRQAAAELDRREGLDQWRDQDSSDDYDWRLIRSRLRQIAQYRAEGAHRKLINHLRQGLHWNLGNTGNPALYSVARVGTKKLIHQYLEAVCGALEFVSELPEADFAHGEKLRFFHDVALSYGRSALMLSGGATLGLFHVGVVKALYREGLLPTVLSGSSAGSIVASTVATRAPEEADLLLDPANAYYHFWKVLPLKRMLRRGAIMDQAQLLNAIGRNVPDLTFEEAYRASGRILNITVSPAGSNQAPRLLNHLTFPFLYVHEAVLASCAVPVLFPPVMLMTQGEDGARTPYMPLLRWNDGSLKSDLPMLRLRRLHNVNHFIVSQTNPHVLPFMSAREPDARGLLNASRTAAFSTTRGLASGVLNFARANLPTSLRQPLDTAAGLLDQDYRGHINIVPEVSLWRYANVTANPSMDNIQRFILEGERSTWSRMEMIRNQTQISLTLDRVLEKLEAEATPMATPHLKAAHAKPGLRMVRNRP
jgi:TAG lipase / steryl ester hydrolase / phospholipase A2 / LPA acyltransferase